MGSDLIWHNDSSTATGLTLPGDDCPRLNDAVTVEAWVRHSAGHSEGLQPVVSRWTPRVTFDAFSAFDAGNTGGIVTKGFYGAVFDGRHIYYCPIRSREERTSVHGCVLRFDTHQPFADPASYVTYDAGSTNGLHTAGFYGAVFDGRFIYFIPRDDGVTHHSRFLRLDTLGEFTDAASWTAFDARHPHSFQGAAFDGRYIYCCPGYCNPGGGPFRDAVESGVVMRLDTRGEFGDRGSYRTFDAQTVDSRAVCYDGAAFDGRFVYFAPLTRGVVLRFDTFGEFGDRDSWQVFEGAAVGLGPCVGAVFDGRHLYFVPFGSGRVVRFDSTAEFDDGDSWSVADAATALKFEPAGYKGGFFDGRFVYFVPFRGDVSMDSHRSPFHGNYLRYDTAGPFVNNDSWEARDAGFTNGLHTTAFTAGASDGRYLYAAPWRSDLDDGGMHGRILRYDTVGSSASFSLRACEYGHNGGLCGALPGPTFIVNTDAGPFSVRAFSTLCAGWHHLAGVYDGASVSLYVDGKRIDESPARGTLLGQEEDIAVGHIDGGTARFPGHIGEVRVSPVDRDHNWMKKRCEKLAGGTPAPGGWG